ncbi:MAG TPA: hypothetical protein VGN93_30855 [Shinella sp.]|jgi:hypothetical protein|uniref:hypothetical protein n=1 Tax=Shinella TaxID=323620 RepID=UPI0007DA79AA|nr:MULTISPECIES: hypothetical protein [Shinella]CAI0341891.1 conserved hypothetical protein [Rhizobiaceae bacterium]CAK7262350.1 conserved protein of unknown function [Shinella sp. WSC3-e]ANH09049.1 hypothetical protein shn_33530 [Shinella sp. HZN7]MDC7260341.1 hypothetical protein [Shinella sp. YE25]HEV7251398.1 hypothetical protein [Shinella sp.]
MTTRIEERRQLNPKDFAIWPDGSWAQIEDIWRGDYTWKSDDYEVIGYDDERRLREVGIADDPDWR